MFNGWRKKHKNTPQPVSSLEQEQLKTSVILESITDGVMILSPTGTVSVINQSCADMLGWDHTEAVNLDYKSLFSVESDTGAEETPIDAITEVLSTKKASQKLSLIKTKHEHHLYIDIVASPIIDTTPQPGTTMATAVATGVVAVLRNVDSQKRQEQQRSDFISTASHEMRTPVASIQGFIELALNPKVATVDDKARGYLQKAYEATKHLGELFQDLLTVSKSEDGRLVNHPVLIDVNEFLTEIVEQDAHRAQEKGLALSFDQPTANGKIVNPLMYVNVDHERLHEIVSNLVENAIKYTPKGLITLGASTKDRGVVIRVSDTGLGIATEDIPHLFQKFYRTDNSATREIGGTGLGLFITKQIVEMMGGKIWVESTLGSGSTFYVEIPRVAPEQLAALKSQQEQADKA